MAMGIEQASLQAQKSSSMKKFFAEGGKNILDMWIGVAPIVMAIGTLALIVAEYTPIFQWLGMPFHPAPRAHACSRSTGRIPNIGCRICGYVSSGYISRWH